MSSNKINVAVRVRPFNKREIELGTGCIVQMQNNQTILLPPPPIEKDSQKQPKTFAFDECFNSLDPSKPDFDGQEQVFNNVGKDILDNAFQGYNACIFAYGQTGSGKSYTMMGSSKGNSQGVIPRLCNALFERIAEKTSPSWQAKVEVSYMEIYNEKVHDLLDPTTSSKHGLKVREHTVLGPYVDGLSQLAVSSYKEIDSLMVEGNKSRTVASTNMNNESSRSHAVFTVILTQTLTDVQSGVSGEKVSKMSLVDLAGSERAVKTGAVGERLKEGSNINRSLTTLGLVISKLADKASSKSNKDKFVPYRDSTLTWLLKDNLGGNSKTVMVATISPAADNYEETLSTLRYADRAKRIVNHAVVNEDPNARIIRELRAEVDALKEMLKHAAQPDVLNEKLSENEKLMKEMSLTWEEKLFKTGQTQEDRRHALEKLGVSVSGIKVESKYFLVNLNSDPSLNELLVYYLKDSTLVGRDGDIQLSGVGIQPKHCIIDIQNDRVCLVPLEGSRTCVNGVEIHEKTVLRNGDRILWGSNHFFRINCPKSSEDLNSPVPVAFDWTMAQEEVMRADLNNDPIQEAIARLEKQYEEEKQSALKKQRQEYEKHFQQLKNYMSPSTPYMPYDPFKNSNGKTPSTPTVLLKLEKWGQERDEAFKRSLSKLQEDIVRANGLVREANFFAEEMGRETRFSVTLQIPPQNLSPNRRRGAIVSEPAILVKRKDRGNQIWSIEKLNLKLIDMRELYDEVKRDPHQSIMNKSFSDPFYETTESYDLIGVANLFLNVLFHDVVLEYYAPIISQHGETAGRLKIGIQKVSGNLIPGNYESSSESANLVQLKVTIKEAVGLPPASAHFVFCQYTFWGDSDVTVVPPLVNGAEHKGETEDSATFQFENVKEFLVPVNEEFIEHCAEGALSVEIYGQQSLGLGPQWDTEKQKAKARSLADRWSELTRKLELKIEVQELNDAGEYVGVEVQPRLDVGSGGIFQLRQGQQRRIVASVDPIANSGTLPIICESITSIAVGSPCVRSKLQKPLDSYQDDDLNALRSKWNDALSRRRDYLGNQIQKYMKKNVKTDVETEREQSLVAQWVCLTEERNSVMVPAPNSGVPGAPADWEPPDGTEVHVPVLFLDLNADDLSTGYAESADEVIMYGSNSILPKEHGSKFFNLPIIRFLENEVGSVAAWDSSIHDSLCLNRVTPGNERAYLIVKAVVRLSHPTVMDLVLRKRVCFNIYKKYSLTDKIRRSMGHTSNLSSLSAVYEIVSNIPKASEELEDRESLAVMAASCHDDETVDGETFIEKYTKGVSAVETILVLDRLRQDVAVKERLKNKSLGKECSPTNGSLSNSSSGAQPFMRKTLSVPNISHVMMSNSTSFDNISSMMKTSESFSELCSDSLIKRLNNSNLNSNNPVANHDSHASSINNNINHNNNNNNNENSKPFGLASRPTSLNLNFSFNSRLPSSNSLSGNGFIRNSPGSIKKATRMTTLHEEDNTKEGEEVIEEDEQESQVQKTVRPINHNVLQRTQQFQHLTNSQTTESLNDLQSTKISTPSMVSSGYGSQAVSSNTLSSDDSMSCRSISADVTPDTETVNPKELLHLLPLEDNNASDPRTDTLDFLYISEDFGHLLSPPDVSLTSISPGEDDRTVAGETPSSHASLILVSPTSANSPSIPPTPCSSMATASLTQTTITTTTTACSKSTNLSRRRKCRTSPTSSSFSRSSNNGNNMNNNNNNNIVEYEGRGSVDEEEIMSTCNLRLPEWMIIGEIVTIRPNFASGSIAFLGTTEFASGLWVGIVLDSSIGKNDGSVKGVRYFNCPHKRGVFVRPDKVFLDRKNRRSSGGGEGLVNNVMKRSSSRGSCLSSSTKSTCNHQRISRK
ncbi:kinesin-like protein KIF13A isoform X2 [Lepeophtheirus salmonis]|uniref:kinesin-like protein KIF13A isoform X2 n=1 Tax=Lepeophtheirus salmonis TaxID=72036 RepID=UPI001AE1D58A|nr:kinesin-like protein KIF13A isoform X2 [Lepeophtheirus salmonis]